MTTPESGPVLLAEQHGPALLLTLNRPAVMNAVDGELATALGEAVEAAAAAPSVRAIVITGAGDRAFCAGMDLTAFAAGRDIGARGHREWGFAGLVRHFVEKPVIAAVNGVALGGGAELALSTDLIVADERASFGLPEVLRGLFAAAGGVIRLAQQLPQRIAMELVLTGRSLDAEEALRWGLVNEVAPAGAAVERALALADRIAAAAPLPLAASKRIMAATGRTSSWDDAPWELNDRELARILASEDAREGVRAFAQKRSPVWTGR